MTKTKRFSRIITFALVMLMVVAMAVPAFANAFYPSGSSNYLNLYGNSGIHMRPLSLYNQYNGPDQQFAFTAYKITGTEYTADYLQNNYYPNHAVNRSSIDARAFMYYLDAASARDSAFALIDYGTIPNRFKLRNYNEYLCAIGTTNGSEIYFKSPAAYSPTWWYVRGV